ncbi:hypothetical protein Rfer_4318 (plasmid) [Rhodoferax ferrireducens T118]|uniref:Uncharacterized protein n=1 Tax=Albidiferax ferrireducens (strain ATCC BAA-621 / DSM 15236 / T118) TaxID=338969 RepID=Q21QE1_ALBFT|nr:hypothetical protein Rfer_4318 [Rhodoferax ferrireducens T118]
MRTARLVSPSPDAAGVERLIAVHIAQRSDATERFGRVPPRSLFDIDRDAEVQDIQRNVAQLKNDTAAFLALQVRKTARLKYALAVTAMAFLASIGVIVGQHYIASPVSPGMTLAAKAVAKVPAPLASLPPVAPAPVAAVAAASPLPVATTRSPVAVVAMVSATTAERAPATTTPLAVAGPVVKVAPPVAKPTVATTPVHLAERVPMAVQPQAVKISAPPVPARAIVVVPPPVIPKVPVTAPVKPVGSPSRTKPEPAPSKKPPAEEKVFALEAQQGGTAPAISKPVGSPQSTFKPEPALAPKTLPAPVVVKPSPQHSDKTSPKDVSRASATAASANVEVIAGGDKHEPVSGNPSAGEPAKSPKVASTARREKYGAAGVITMTPTGVVVFDAERRAQRMVPIGGRLHDGSVLKSIDAKSNRISTDAGDVIFD